MKGDPIKRLKQQLASAASYVEVQCGDIIAACDRCGPLDEVVGALWKGSHGQKIHQRVAVRKCDLEHLLNLLERGNGPSEPRIDVVSGQDEGKRVSHDHLPPPGRQRVDPGHAGPDAPATANDGRQH